MITDTTVDSCCVVLGILRFFFSSNSTKKDRQARLFSPRTCTKRKKRQYRLLRSFLAWILQIKKRPTASGRRIMCVCICGPKNTKTIFLFFLSPSLSLSFSFSSFSFGCIAVISDDGWEAGCYILLASWPDKRQLNNKNSSEKRGKKRIRNRKSRHK